VLKISRLLVAGLLVLTMGSVGVNAETQNASVVMGERQSIIDPVQFYEDGGRCFNRCFSGRTARRCQVAESAEKANCCSWVCNRRNNWYYRSR
jgi:hypothetical protein